LTEVLNTTSLRQLDIYSTTQVNSAWPPGHPSGMYTSESWEVNRQIVVLFVPR